MCGRVLGKVQGLEASKMQVMVERLSSEAQPCSARQDWGSECASVSTDQDLHRARVTQCSPSSISAGKQSCASCHMLRKPTVSAVWGQSVTLGEGLKA